MSYFSNQADEGDLDLKMTILRLEEELNLYRNGMSGVELLTIIAEKDRDIAGLQASLTETNEKLRKIAKGSSEVLMKLNLITSEKADLDETVQSLTGTVATLEANVAEKDENIVKLQARCAQLVQEKSKEKSETNKKLKEFKVTIMQPIIFRCHVTMSYLHQDELEKAIRFNMEIKKSVHDLSTSNSQLTQEVCSLRLELAEVFS
jgi:DNA repair exonuclease SbcCD ATPase subunit